MVNGDGVRFTNEAGNYNAMGGVLHAFYQVEGLPPRPIEIPNEEGWRTTGVPGVVRGAPPE